MTPKAQIRDILAIPVTLVGIVCMFATLPLFALAATIGGKWTIYSELNLSLLTLLLYRQQLR